MEYDHNSKYNSNHTVPPTSFKIVGTISPSSLASTGDRPTEHDIVLWKKYLEEHLRARLEGITNVELRAAPFGGTRLAAVGTGLLPGVDALREISESILNDFCFNYDSIAHHGMTEGFAKPGDVEC